MIAAYVSGHGYGHATRVGEVLRVLRERAPDIPISVVTSGPEALYRQAVGGPVSFRVLECDVGLVQRDALVIDEPATAESCRRFDAGWARLVTEQARRLREAGARVVLGDIPPLAFAAAAEAGVPSAALANFSWDWIYRHLSGRQPDLARAAQRAAEAYGRTDLLLELPFAGDLSAFPRRERIPLVARRPRLARAEARRRLGLDGKPVVLLSFGGLGLPGFSPLAVAPLTEFRFVTTEGARALPANVVHVEATGLGAIGLSYVDLVAAADVVVTKPGYGIVSDAIAAGTRIVYTERGDFPEYPVLVRGMERFLPCAHVGNGDLLSGRLGEAIESVLGRPLPEPPDLGGAEVAARWILQMAGA